MSRGGSECYTEHDMHISDDQTSVSVCVVNVSWSDQGAPLVCCAEEPGMQPCKFALKVWNAQQAGAIGVSLPNYVLRAITHLPGCLLLDTAFAAVDALLARRHPDRPWCCDSHCEAQTSSWFCR